MGPSVLLEQALALVLKKQNFPAIAAQFEHPDNPAHGDYATNVALRIAKKIGRPPMDIAKELARTLMQERLVERVEAKPPGFVNIFLSSQWLQEQVLKVLLEGTDFGRSKIKGKLPKVQIEFISANPTGPLTLANGRGGFLGDTLGNILIAAGANVVREYYVNDAGEQVKKLGWAILAAKGYQTPYNPEELYRGEYIKELADKLDIPVLRSQDSKPDSLVEYAAREGSKLLLKDIKRVVRKAGIHFDVWFSEKSLYRQRFVDEILKNLKRRDLVEKKEGALWLRAQELGTSKDKVLVKSSGEPTYLVPDLAYHWEKFKRRKFEKVIDIVGADHHGHMQVLKTGLKILGVRQPEVILVQFVRLMEKGKEAKMSKRAGTFVTLEELLDAVGGDVTRWFFLQSSPSRHMDFDLDLAREQSEKNPVYYVQYAHARISSILVRAADMRGIKTQKRAELLNHPSEIGLIKQIVQLPDLVARIAQNYEVHHLTTYATELATAFHAFYRDCRVISDDTNLTAARLSLCRATQITLANTLRFMGIRAPQRMWS